MKVITSGKDLVGKKIKYCGIENGAEIENTLIITEDNEIMMFSCDYDSYCYTTYSEHAIERKMLTWDYIKRHIIASGAVTNEEFEVIKEEHEREKKKHDEQVKKLRYEKYLKLKKEFEP